jgi:hypothetical protein
MQDVFDRIQRGDLHARIDAAGELQQDLHRLETAINGMTRGLVFASLLIAATLLTIAGRETIGIAVFAIAGIAWLALALRPRR